MKLKYFILLSFIITISCTPNFNINDGETASFTYTFGNESFSWSGTYTDLSGGSCSYDNNDDNNDGFPSMNLYLQGGPIINFFANQPITPGTYTTDQFAFLIQYDGNYFWSPISGQVTITSISPNSVINSSVNYGLVKGNFSGVVANPVTGETKNLSGSFECVRVN